MYQIPIEYDSNTVEPPNKGHALWGQYKFRCCVLCREVVLSSEVQKVCETNFWDLDLWQGREVSQKFKKESTMNATDPILIASIKCKGK